MSFTNVFGGSTLQPADVAYRTLSFSANLTLAWPPFTADPTLVAARSMDVTATAPGLSLALPPANQVSTGYDMLVSNRGSNAFTVLDNAGGAVATVNPGASKYLQVTGNASPAGAWNSVAFGAVTAAPDAASLAGLGIGANGAQLYAKQPVSLFSADNTITFLDRAATYVWTGGSGTQNLPAAASVGADFFYSVRNQGSGTLTLTANGAELIDGSASIILQPTESAEVHAGSGNWYTVGRGRSVQFSFSLLVKGVTTGTVTLSSTEAANVVQRYTGALVGNVNVVLPSVVQVYYISNQTSGAFSVTFKTAGVGSTVTVPTNQNAILFCDGLNVINTATTVSGITGLLLAQGTVSAPAIGFSGDANTGIYQPTTDQVAVTSNGVQVANFTGTGLSMSASMSIFNARFGNSAVASGLVLDWYEENSFTPGLTFGGASVGMTFSRVSGNFVRIGRIVFYAWELTLSAKGSSTGVAVMTGFPYAAGGGQSFETVLGYSGLASNPSPLLARARVPIGTTSNLVLIDNGSNSGMNDANFTNTSSLNATGFYFV